MVTDVSEEPIAFILKVEDGGSFSSKISIMHYQTTRRHHPEGPNMNIAAAETSDVDVLYIKIVLMRTVHTTRTHRAQLCLPVDQYLPNLQETLGSYRPINYHRQPLDLSHFLHLFRKI